MTGICALLKSLLPELETEPAASWNRYTTLGAGTAPFCLVRPRTFAELHSAVKVLSDQKTGMYILGAGTNLVGSDSILDGIVIRPSLPAEIRLETGTRISVNASAVYSAFILKAAEMGFGGMAGLSGIPGTIGGAVAMNAGANGVDTGKFVRRIEGISLADCSDYVLEPKAEDWGYRRSCVPSGILITRVVFELEKRNPAEEMELIRQEKERRGKVTPPGRSAGSIFRNPEGFSAGKLLEDSGCKGLHAGAYSVAPEHANWIISRQAEEPLRERDVRTLTDAMRQAVLKHTGILLKTELRFVKMESSKLKILVLKGGISSEREVSLISGKAVADALRTKGHDVEEYDIRELVITDAMRKADIVYPVLHGGFGEDGRLQKMLEEAGLRFVGCGSKACMDLMDKVTSKQIMDSCGVRNASSVTITDHHAPVVEKFGFPVIVKPPCEGSTFGLTLVESADQWQEALDLCFKHDKVALVEKYIKGIEATVGILDGQALPLVEIRYPGKLYDYDAKYTHAHGETQYICPPTGISEAACRDASEQALKFYKASNARDMLRVDVIIDADDKAWVLEGNTLPGCTPSSLLPKAAAAAGIPFPDMCDRLAHAAAKR